MPDVVQTFANEALACEVKFSLIERHGAKVGWRRDVLACDVEDMVFVDIVADLTRKREEAIARGG